MIKLYNINLIKYLPDNVSSGPIYGSSGASPDVSLFSIYYSIYNQLILPTISLLLHLGQSSVNLIELSSTVISTTKIKNLQSVKDPLSGTLISLKIALLFASNTMVFFF